MISIVIPMFNEAAGVKMLYNRLVASVSFWEEDCEFIIGDDGSRDNTLDLG
jgi:glycosyltransferase involved in cell wall biosynthesis